MNERNKLHLPPTGLGQQHHFVTYVKKWIRTKHAILFRLSNKLVQVVFSDKTEILLNGGDNNAKQRTVTYVDKKEHRHQYSLQQALFLGVTPITPDMTPEQMLNAEMAKRLKYTKEMLTHMLQDAN